MEAQLPRAAAPTGSRSNRRLSSSRLLLAIVGLLAMAFAAPSADAAGYRTANFTVDAPTPRLAKEIGDAAEQYRSQLAQEWLGKSLPNWAKPCPIKARVAPGMDAGGATSFIFDRGEVFGWRMEVQGSRERILDSVIPHEVTHTIFASHFRQPIPRWADEGACTTVEHHSEVSKMENNLIEYLQTRRSIPFSNMFAMKEYPSDILPLYAQGHSLARFLIDQRGKREFLAFLGDGLADENWIRAVHQRYGYRSLLALQNSWQNWVVQGRPPLQLAANAQTDTILVASYETPNAGPAPPAPSQQAWIQPARSTATLRGQNPNPITPTTATPLMTLSASGISGPIVRRPQGEIASHAPWTAVSKMSPAVAQAPATARTPTGWTASVYDARVGGRILR